jgi:alpha-L-fucosidase
MADGRIEPGQVARLKEMGQWLHSYGDSIYATRGGPFIPGSWGAGTRKGNTICLHVMSWPEDTMILPPIAHRITESTVLTGGTVNVNQTEKAIEVSVPRTDRRDLDTIIVLELDGPASEIAPLPLPVSSLTAGKSIKASSTFFDPRPPHADAENAVDDDVFTRWAADAGTKQAWLGIDLGEPTTFNRARISEEFDRVQEFELQYKEGDGWRTFARGSELGPDYSSQFESVTAGHVRFNILNASDATNIWEFQLFAPREQLGLGNRRFVVPAPCVQSAMCPKAVFQRAFRCVVGRPEHLDQAAQLLEVDVTRAPSQAEFRCQVGIQRAWRIGRRL